jgi:SP family general alpha glucoside:H+ symporter-like MFS transporter
VAGLNSDQAYALGLGNTGIQLVCVVISVGLSSRFGRRTLVLWGLGFNCLCLALMGILACLRQSPGATWAQGILVIIIGAQWGLTLGPMCWTIVGETSSLRLRALTVGLSRDAYYLSSVVLGISESPPGPLT